MAKDKQINLRLTESENAFLRNRADEAGMSLSEYIMQLAKNKKVYSKESTSGLIGNLAFLSEQLQSLTLELSKGGRNINTIAKAVNANNYINKSDMAEYLIYFKKYTALLDNSNRLVDDLKTSLSNIYKFLSGDNNAVEEFEKLNYIISLLSEAQESVQKLKKEKE